MRTSERGSRVGAAAMILAPLQFAAFTPVEALRFRSLHRRDSFLPSTIITRPPTPSASPPSGFVAAA